MLVGGLLFVSGIWVDILFARDLEKKERADEKKEREAEKKLAKKQRSWEINTKILELLDMYQKEPNKSELLGRLRTQLLLASVEATGKVEEEIVKLWQKIHHPVTKEDCEKILAIVEKGLKDVSECKDEVAKFMNLYKSSDKSVN